MKLAGYVSRQHIHKITYSNNFYLEIMANQAVSGTKNMPQIYHRNRITDKTNNSTNETINITSSTQPSFTSSSNKTENIKLETIGKRKMVEGKQVRNHTAIPRVKIQLGDKVFSSTKTENNELETTGERKMVEGKQVRNHTAIPRVKIQLGDKVFSTTKIENVELETTGESKMVEGKQVRNHTAIPRVKIPLRHKVFSSTQTENIEAETIGKRKMVEDKQVRNRIPGVKRPLGRLNKICCITCCDDILASSVATSKVSSKSSVAIEMVKDARYYMQHPYVRIFITYLVMFMNFIFYAQDPSAHSITEASLPLPALGKDFNFIFRKYPPGIASYIKIVMWMWGIAYGIFVGNIFIHGLLFNRIFRLQMFSKGQGAWMVTFWCIILCLWAFLEMYNILLLSHGGYKSYLITSCINMTTDNYFRITAIGTFVGDLFTAFNVWDVILQEKLYPHFGMALRRWWNVKYHRIYTFWFTFVFLSTLVTYNIYVNEKYFDWDSLNVDVGLNTELWRAFLAAGILVLDLTIVMQDWDFPHFDDLGLPIKLPGLNSTKIKFYFFKVNWVISITGKWFNYSVLLLVLILDVQSWTEQINYNPSDYAQYTHPDDGRIYNVNDRFSVDNMKANKTIISFAFRNSTINPRTGKLYIEGDTLLSARYIGYDSGLKAIAIIPVLIAVIVLVALIIIYGRKEKPTEMDPYAGRALTISKWKFLLFSVPESEGSSSSTLLTYRYHSPFDVTSCVDSGETYITTGSMTDEYGSPVDAPPPESVCPSMKSRRKSYASYHESVREIEGPRSRPHGSSDSEDISMASFSRSIGRSKSMKSMKSMKSVKSMKSMKSMNSINSKKSSLPSASWSRSDSFQSGTLSILSEESSDVNKAPRKGDKRTKEKRNSFG